jgi:hypothetical protein
METYKIKTVIETLNGMGYNPEVNEDKGIIHFSSPGFENFKNSEKNIIRMNMGGDLMEFYYENDTQYIYYKP